MRDLYFFGAGAIVASVVWDIVFTKMEARWMRERQDLRVSLSRQAAVIAQRPRSTLPTDPRVIAATIDEAVGPATFWEGDAPESYGV